ncbi:unnamed protein product [Pedinophyceae sp. YPF-701]|nr:unnamed protein product [Pedinophyceae sp. YPF-701]
MARNSEKAQTMLNRYIQMKQDEAKGEVKKRPYLASECSDLFEADKWRQQILKEISRKVMEIQNPALGEHRTRDLNDEINKLIREKGHWEKRVKELGGPDYAKMAPKTTDLDGNELHGATGRGAGYRYFGAAKSLPGVKELFEKQAPRKVRKTRAQLLMGVDADYFGLRDEEDGVLVEVEAAAEARMREEELARWREKEAERAAEAAKVQGGRKRRAGEAAGGAAGGAEGAGEERFVAYVPLPDDKDIEARVVERKKKQLLARYQTEGLMREQEKATEVLRAKPDE